MIIHNDCLKVLKKMPADSIDAIITDPPYSLKFMNKDWDKAIPKLEIWQNCLKVLKAGAFAFIMSSPRQDCLCGMIAKLEEAGFNTGFTSIYWTYASGFPKARNISKVIDKKAGAKRKELAKNPNTSSKWTNRQNTYGWADTEKGSCQDTFITEPATDEAKKFDGAYGGFQPKPAVEIILVCMKPLSEKTYTEQALKNSKGITWLDDCRIPYATTVDKDNCGFANKTTEFYNFTDDKPQAGKRTSHFFEKQYTSGGIDPKWEANNVGRFPANVIVSDDILNEHSRFFDIDKWTEKVFPWLICPKASKKEKEAGLDDMPEKVKSGLPLRDGNKENYVVNEAGDGSKSSRKTKARNIHPTVKPIKLMSYLITLGSREGDRILDPFAGTGTTGIACKLLKRKYICIEKDKAYFEIMKKRLAY